MDENLKLREQLVVLERNGSVNYEVNIAGIFELDKIF